MDSSVPTFVLLLLLLISCFSSASSDNTTDRQWLLSVKDHLSDPHESLSSWNGTTHYCNWAGVSCSHSHPDRVTAIDLTSLGLSGKLSPSVGNLTFLHTLVLDRNGISGWIPPSIGRLRRLQLLNLSYNSFSGEIPANLTRCSALRTLSLGANNLTGIISTDLGSLSELVTLLLYNNSLSGSIPPSIGNLSSLSKISLAINHLEGGIPHELGKLRSSLKFFQVGENNLTGSIPPSFYNLSSLYFFAVAANNGLEGSLPSDLGTRLPNLRFLYLDGNQFRGPIPNSLTNISRLEHIDLGDTNFSGVVPRDLGRLQNLSYLDLQWTQLGGSKKEDWRFMDSLVNCSKLLKIIFYHTNFGGVLPESVANLSTQLQFLDMSNNRISGFIPSGIGNLVNLNGLGLGGNLFVGPIPEEIGKLGNLNYLDLLDNQLGGDIPSSVGNLSQLIQLDLQNNNFEGSIPSSSGKLQNLQTYELSYNSLNGTIPKEIFNLSYLLNYMDLSYNYLVGPLPHEVGNLKSLEDLRISGNKLSGEIPSSLSTCVSLEFLILDNNSFSGTIPSSLGNMKGLRWMDLSQNNLSGTIPSSFSRLNGLNELYLLSNSLSGSVPAFLGNLPLDMLNLSFNHFEGPVPVNGIFSNASAVSLAGNDELCGGVPELHLPACPTKNHRGWSLMLKIIVSIVSVIVLLLLISSIALLWTKRESRARARTLADTTDQFSMVSYRELVKATDGFSSANLIGKGSYGSVYKGTMDGGSTFIAVKVFNLERQGASKSFLAECEALRGIRHRNLIKILTSCSSIDSKENDFKALVFEFMPNTSLEEWLHPRGDAHQGPNHLSLTQRLSIATNVADAMDYLHHDCQPPIVHCDLKPSNVLLDTDMVALVGDFGLAKFISESMSMSLSNASSSAAIRGTIGYTAPEYGTGGQVSTSADVYSFGIVILEMLTGKRPVNDMFNNGLTLYQFVETSASLELIHEITDPLLLQDLGANGDERGSTVATNFKKCLVSMMTVGLRCSSLTPSSRMDIRDVANEMHAIRRNYIADR